MIAANGTRVNDNIPAPQGHRVPFFNFEAGQKRQDEGQKRLTNTEAHHGNAGVIGMVRIAGRIVKQKKR